MSVLRAARGGQSTLQPFRPVFLRTLLTAGGLLALVRISLATMLYVRPTPGGFTADAITLLQPEAGLLGISKRMDGGQFTLLIVACAIGSFLAAAVLATLAGAVAQAFWKCCRREP